MTLETRQVGAPTTWVVLCTKPDGRPFPEYVEGVAISIVDGTITIHNGPDVVRSYPKGSWLNYCEWVTSSGFFDGMVIRGSASMPTAVPSPLPAPRHAAETRSLPSVSPRRNPLPETARPVTAVASGLPLSTS